MSKIKNISATMAGTALEFYDIILYGFFSSLLAPLFSPSLDFTTSLLASLEAFAAGFLMRPLEGEYSSAAVFIAEQVQNKRGGSAGSILCSTAFLGAIYT